MARSPAQVAQRWFDEVWDKRKPEVIYELMPADAIGHMMHADFLGPDGFYEAWRAFTAMMPDMVVTADAIIEQGEHAVVRWSIRGTHTGEGFGLAATKEGVSVRGMTWLHCREGQVVEAWDGWDQGALFARLQEVAAKQQRLVG